MNQYHLIIKPHDENVEHIAAITVANNIDMAKFLFRVDELVGVEGVDWSIVVPAYPIYISGTSEQHNLICHRLYLQSRSDRN